MSEECKGGDWGDKGWTWDFRDYQTEEGVSVTLLDVSSNQAYVKIFSHFRDTYEAVISKGEYEMLGDDMADYYVHCDDVTRSPPMAKIRICKVVAEIPDPTPDPGPNPTPDPGPEPTPDGDVHTLPLYGSSSIFGHEFTNTKLICQAAQAVVRCDNLAVKTLVVGGAAAVWTVNTILSPVTGYTTAVIMGGVYAKLESIDDACTAATVRIFQSAWTAEDHDRVVKSIVEEVGSEGSGEFTDEEIERATTQAEQNVSNSDSEKRRQEKIQSGEMTEAEGDVEREQEIVDETYRILYSDNFNLEIASFVFAGEIPVAGGAPKQNQPIEIRVKKSFLGFDWLAADATLATTTSDENYHYETQIVLDDFGIIEVYSAVEAGWLNLVSDLESEHHTVFVITPTILLAFVILTGLVLDKKYGFLGVTGKKRRR